MGIWPVGFAGLLNIQKPLVDDGGKIIGWDTVMKQRQKYAIDSGGFAFSIKLLLKSADSIDFISNFHQTFDMYDVESAFLTKLNITLDKAEPLGIKRDGSLNEVLVWNIKQIAFQTDAEKEYFEKFNKNTDYGWIL